MLQEHNKTTAATRMDYNTGRLPLGTHNHERLTEIYRKLSSSEADVYSTAHTSRTNDSGKFSCFLLSPGLLAWTFTIETDDDGRLFAE